MVNSKFKEFAMGQNQIITPQENLIVLSHEALPEPLRTQIDCAYSVYHLSFIGKVEEIPLGDPKHKIYFVAHDQYQDLKQAIQLDKESLTLEYQIAKPEDIFLQESEEVKSRLQAMEKIVTEGQVITAFPDDLMQFVSRFLKNVPDLIARNQIQLITLPAGRPCL